MFLFNLSLPEFLALFSALSGVVVALYLLDRVKKKHTVATLRFYTVLDKAPQYRHRRKLQQPWSLLLQLISLTLLLLALAQLRLGSPDRYSNDHVLILDSSAWMAARSGEGRLIDKARAAAKSYLKALPAHDRVMLVRADALATPATQFESDRLVLQRAIDATQPGASVLNIGQALSFAGQTQKLHAQHAGDIVFVGAGRIPADAGAAPAIPPNFRLISVNGPAENSGIRKLTLRRSLSNPDTWDIFVAVKNYGTRPKSVPLVVLFGGAPVGTRRFELPPGAEDTATFHYATRAAGWIEARLLGREPFSLDDRAVLELPSRDILPVTVYSDDPNSLKPIFTAIPGIQTTFLPTSRYTPKTPARLVVLDRFAPTERPTVDSVWMVPPAAKSPIYVAGTDAKVKLTRWKQDSELTAGLHTKDLELDQTEFFRPASGDIALADSTSGPVIVVRPSAPRMVVFGFDPGLAPMKYELTTPLLFANLVRWVAPEVFTTYELTAGTVGTVNVELESEADPATIRVLTENRQPLPFTLEGKSLRFFDPAPGIVRVSTGSREIVYSLTLPQAGDVVWKPTGVRTGIPRRADLTPGSRDLWQWLALLGAIGFAIDWFLFGRGSRTRRVSKQAPRNIAWRKAS
jgi:hypothetical protein